MPIDPVSHSGPEVSIGVAADVYRIAKEEIPGGRVLVPAVLSLLFFWGVWNLIGWVYADVEPVVSSLASSGGQLSLRWQDFASAALTLVAVGGVYFLFTRRLNKWQYNVMDSLSDHLDERFDAFPSATDLSGLATRVKEIEKLLKIGPQRREFAPNTLGAILTPEPFNYELQPTRVMDIKMNVLRIESARYGWGDKWSDVTMEVQRLLKDERTLEFKVDNTTLDRRKEKDPYPGQQKALEIVYSLNGIYQQPRTWREKDICKLP